MYLLPCIAVQGSFGDYMKKFLVVLLSILYVFSLGCSNSSINMELYVNESDIWMDSSVKDVMADESLSMTPDTIIRKFEYCDGKNIYVRISGWIDENHLEPLNKLYIYNIDTNCEYVLNIYDLFDDTIDLINIIAYANYNDTCYLLCNEVISSKEEYSIYTLDLENSQCHKMCTIVSDSILEVNTNIDSFLVSSDGYYIEYSSFENCCIEKIDSYGNSLFQSNFINVNGASRNIVDCSTTKLMCLIRIQENASLIYKRIEIDKTTGVITYFDVNNPVEDSTLYLGSDCNLYQYDLSNGRILGYSYNTNECFIAFDFNYCEINYRELINTNYRYFDGKTLILEEYLFDDSINNKSCKMIILTKRDSNPHLGKRIMRMASLYDITLTQAEARKRFNNTHNEVFLIVDNTYQLNRYIDSGITDYNLSQQYSRSCVSSKLINDINSGTAPNILLGFGEINILNNDRYLMDLNSVTVEKLNLNEFFSNAFCAMQNSGSLFQIPLSMSVLGIRSDVGILPVTENNGIGVDAYRDFVISELKGNDLIAFSDSAEYLNYLFSESINCFIHDGTFNIDDNHFDSLVELVEVMPTSYDVDYDLFSLNMVNDKFDFWNLSVIYGDTWQFYGAPSLDYRGPALYTNNTVAVTSCSMYEEESFDYVIELLSYDIQVMMQEGAPINLQAFRDYASQDFYVFDDNMNSYTVSLNELQIERYESLLFSIDTYYSEDSEILYILDEEMMSYFTGDKTLDEVIAIIEDRCQTVLDERK